jgi:integrase
LSVVRGFARHLQGLDPRTEVPPGDLLPARFRRAVPYLYSGVEIERLMHAIRTIRSPLRAATYQTLVGLLAVTGMRVGEALGLDRDDLDTAGGLLVVRLGKNGKPREVALHPSTIAALGAYAGRRAEFCPRPSSPSFFVSTAGTRLDYRSVWREFDRLRRLTGLTGRSRSRPPRLHDLRHTFVLRTLLNWYGAGVDIEAQLPLLSTYLGHVDPSSTYWYFQAAPELLALAAERLERAWEGLP